MIEDRQVIIQKRSTGDAAVQGLFAGFGAGLVMAAVLVLAGALSERSLNTVISRFAAGAQTTPQTTPLAALFTTVAIAGVYGALFGVLHCWLLPGWLWRRLNPLVGLVYGVLLWLVADLVGRTGIDAPMPALSAWQLALAHLVYGLNVGIMFAKNEIG